MAQLEHKDQKYLEGIKNGDSKILEEIYVNYAPAILKLVKQNNGTAEDARDVIQESLIIVLKKVRNSDLKLTSTFLTYFYSICRHVWWKMLKKNKRTTVTIEGELGLIDSTDIEKEIIQRERHQFYLKKMEELSAGCRQILRLYIEGKRMKEIVAIMGFKSEGYARKRKFKCKEKLLNRIKNDAYYVEHYLMN